jgi:hypothetical protein
MSYEARFEIMDTRNASKKWFTREKKWIFSDEYDINLAE